MSKNEIREFSIPTFTCTIISWFNTWNIFAVCTCGWKASYGIFPSYSMIQTQKFLRNCLCVNFVKCDTGLQRVYGYPAAEEKTIFSVRSLNTHISERFFSLNPRAVMGMACGRMVDAQLWVNVWQGQGHSDTASSYIYNPNKVSVSGNCKLDHRLTSDDDMPTYIRSMSWSSQTTLWILHFANKAIISLLLHQKFGFLAS